MEVTTDVSDCALGVDGLVCSDSPLIVEIANILNIDSIPDIKHVTAEQAEHVIKTAITMTNCDGEKCVVTHPTITKKASKKLVDEALKNKLKPYGPSNSTALLNNTNIDTVLRQIMANPKYRHFFTIDFQMIDFNGSDRFPPSKLATIDVCKDLIEKEFKTFGVVLNTDTRSGRGKHWFCIFCDFRHAGTKQVPYTLEYFNSSGNPAPKAVHKWLVDTETAINNYKFSSGASTRHAVVVQASTIQHQRGKTECGPYSLYYIWSRVNDIPVTSFRNEPIPDKLMHKFRTQMFIE